MKKKTVLIASVVILAAVAAVAFVGMRLARYGTDIIGVTTLPDRNIVIMNSKTGREFVSGTGYLDVAEGEHIHLTCDLSAGSIDLAFQPGGDVDISPADPEDLTDLPDIEDLTAEDVSGQDGISGKTELDFDAGPGAYVIVFTNNGAVGTATVTAEADPD